LTRVDEDLLTVVCGGLIKTLDDVDMIRLLFLPFDILCGGYVSNGRFCGVNG
jgi:hypothetical protein